MTTLSELKSKLGYWAIMLIASAILIAYLADLSTPHRLPPPSDQERADEYQRQLEKGLLNCKYDYPDERQLLLEQGWTYEKCAKAYAAFGMDYWERIGRHERHRLNR